MQKKYVVLRIREMIKFVKMNYIPMRQVDY